MKRSSPRCASLFAVIRLPREFPKLRFSPEAKGDLYELPHGVSRAELCLFSPELLWREQQRFNGTLDRCFCLGPKPVCLCEASLCFSS